MDSESTQSTTDNVSCNTEGEPQEVSRIIHIFVQVPCIVFLRKGTLRNLRRNFSRNDLFSSVNEGLRQHYKKTLRPFEETHLFHSLHSPPLEDAEFCIRPSVLLVGQYSTGKTTFIRSVQSLAYSGDVDGYLIRYLLGEDFMGCRIGPEPTTDK